MKVRGYFPYSLTIDGDEVVLRLKRMTLEEWYAFNATFAKTAQPTILRFAGRQPDGPEQACDEQGTYLVPWEQIVEKRLGEMTAERRAEYDAAVEADEADARVFLTEVFARYVTVERGVIEELPDGTECSVTDGKDFLRVFGARGDVLGSVLAAVRTENTLDASQKKVSPSRVASAGSSGARKAPGPRRATTAAPVGTEASAGNAAATATSPGPSGSMETSLPHGARSVN